MISSNTIDLLHSMIGTVKAYNSETREVGVFLPKLMPGIPEDGQTVPLQVNQNGSKLPENLKLNTSIDTDSLIWIMAEDVDEPMPDIGSKVFVNFIEGNITKGLWRKINVNGDYSVIEEERYPKKFSLNMGGALTDVNLDDEIIVKLPGKNGTLVEDGKRKIIDLETPLQKLFDEKISVNDLSILDKRYPQVSLNLDAPTIENYDRVMIYIGGNISFSAGKYIYLDKVWKKLNQRTEEEGEGEDKKTKTIFSYRGKVRQGEFVEKGTEISDVSFLVEGVDYEVIKVNEGTEEDPIEVSKNIALVPQYLFVENEIDVLTYESGVLIGDQNKVINVSSLSDLPGNPVSGYTCLSFESNLQVLKCGTFYKCQATTNGKDEFCWVPLNEATYPAQISQTEIKLW